MGPEIHTQLPLYKLGHRIVFAAMIYVTGLESINRRQMRVKKSIYFATSRKIVNANKTKLEKVKR